MLRMTMVLVGGTSRDVGVGLGGTVNWFKVEEVDRIVVEVDTLDERKGNIAGCGLGKGSKLDLR